MRLAVVAPRYGAQIGGGAETLAREYATRLAERGHDVTVLTTCALDYRTWEDHFPPGQAHEARVRILRFSVPTPRDVRSFDAMSPHVLANGGSELEERWIDAQGPNAPGLVDHLSERGSDYDAVLFIPYLYATTVRGIPAVTERAVLVPCFHDEPWIRLSVFDEVVARARALAFNTPEEMDLARRRFALPETLPVAVVGAGIDPVDPAEPAEVPRRFGIDRDYLVCVGRIEPSKGTDTLIDAHGAYRRANADGPDLVLVGRPAMEVPRRDWLHTTGFVSEEVKHKLIRGALGLVCPSPFESLSIVLLEAWSHGRPTVSTAASDVLVGQTRRSGGGLWYRDPLEYALCVDMLTSRRTLADAIGRAGRRFAASLSWDHVIGRLERLLEAAADPPADVAQSPDATD